VGKLKGRYVDLKLLALVRTLPCLACGVSPCGEVHHVTTVKNLGGDFSDNCMPLCHRHHMELHQVGWFKAMEKYPAIRTWLELAERHDVIERVESKQRRPI